MPNEHSSRQYEQDLEAIRSRVLQMGGLVEKQFFDELACFRLLDAREDERIKAVSYPLLTLPTDLRVAIEAGAV